MMPAKANGTDLQEVTWEKLQSSNGDEGKEEVLTGWSLCLKLMLVCNGREQSKGGERRRRGRLASSQHMLPAGGPALIRFQNK